MIETARAVSIASANTDYQIASADELPFAPAVFDAVLCLQGLQYFPDRLKALTEMRRVIKPDSRLMAAVWSAIENCKGHWALVTALERRGIDASSARHPFLLSDSGVLRTLAEKAGFKRIAIRTMQQLTEFASAKDFVDAIAKGAPSSRHALAQVSDAEWPGFLSEVEATLAPWQQGATLAFPMESSVLEASC
jgi:ubiquinone/menaquinone biosynthesis C-methylase UbiE